MALVDEKIAKITLDNKSFTSNAEETMKIIDKLKQAFRKVGDDSSGTKNVQKNMEDMSNAVSKSVNKSESILSKLKSIFQKSTSNIDMSGASKSVDKMNTDIANKTSRTSDILSRLRGIFKRADSVDGFPNASASIDKLNANIDSKTSRTASILSNIKSIFQKADTVEGFPNASASIDKLNSDINSKSSLISDSLSNIRTMFQKADNVEGFPNTVSSIDKLSSKVASFDASPLGTAFSSASVTVQNSISAMDIALGNFMANAMSKMVGFGKQFVSGPMDGYAEYANKMTSIQTIKSNTEAAFGGNTKRQMLEINRTLSDLNEYADNTIYSFEDMTRNIGTFTAAGVGLEDSAVAIKGIANLAAASGSSTMQASTAMYQLSQALAAGKVGLMDWNSVVNAGMGGELFKNALYETADALGVARDKSKTFRDSLQDGWLTTEVLLETLKQFSTNESMLDAATKVKTFSELVDTTKEAIGSGWSDTWEHVFGGLEEAKGLWSGVAGEIGKFLDDSQGKYYDKTLEMERSLGNFRNAVLKTWKDNGGQKAFFEGITNSVKALMKNMTMFREGFRSAFGDYKTVAAGLVKATQGFADFSKALSRNTILQGTFKRVGEATGNTIKTFGMILGSVFKGMSQGNVGFRNILTTIQGVAKGITSFMQSIQQNQNVMQGFSNIGRTISNVMGIVTKLFGIGAKIVGQFFSAFNLGNGGSLFAGFTGILADITGGISSFLDKISEGIDKFGLFKALGSVVSGAISLIGGAFKGLGNVFSNFPKINLSSIFSGIMDGLKNAYEGISTFASNIKSKLSGAFGGLKDLFSPLKELSKGISAGDIASIFTALSVGRLAKKVMDTDLIADIFDKIKEPFSWIKKDLKGIVDTISESFDALGGSISSFTRMIDVASLFIISASLFMLASAIKRLSGMDMRDLSKGLIGLGGAVASLLWVAKSLSKLSGLFGKGTATTMMAISFSLLILASAMKKMGEIDSKNLGTAIAGIVSAAIVLVGSMKALSGTKGMQSGILNLIAIAVSLRILASAIAKLKDMSPESLISSVVAMGALIGALTASSKVLSGTKVSVGSIAGLISMAVSMKILVSALKDIADINPGMLVPAVLELVSLMIALTASVKVLDGVKIKMGTLFSLMVYSAALYGLVQSVEKLANLNPDGLIMGVMSVATLLTALSLSTVAISKIKVPLSSMASIMVFTSSMVVLVESIRNLSLISPERLIPSVISVGVLMAALASVTHAVKGAKPSPSAVASLIAFSAGILLLAKSVRELAYMNMDQLIQGMQGVFSLILALVAASHAISSAKVNIASVLQLVAFAGSIKVLVTSVKELGDMSPGSMVAGLTGVTALIFSLTAATVAINASSGTVGSSIKNMANMMVFVYSIKQLSGVLRELSEIPWGNLMASTVSMVSVIGALALASKAMSGVSMTGGGNMLMLGASLVAIAAGLKIIASINVVQAAVGIGILAANLTILLAAAAIAQSVAPGLLSLSISIAALGASSILIASAFTIAAVGIAALAAAIAMLAATAPDAFKNVALGFIEIVTTIGDNAPRLVDSVIKTGREMIRGFVEVLPEFIEAGVKMMTNLLQGLAESAPQLMDAAVKFVIEFARAMIENAVIFVDTAIELVGYFVDGINQALPNILPKITELVIGLMDAVSNELSKNGPKLAESFGNLLGEVVGLLLPLITEVFAPIANAIVQSLEPALSTIIDLVVQSAPVLVPIIETIGSVIETVVDGITRMVEAIAPQISPILDSLTQMIIALTPVITALIDGIITGLEILAPVAQGLIDAIIIAIETLGGIIQGAIGGIVQIFQIVSDTILGIGQLIVDGINGIANVITAVGSVIESVGNAIKSVFEGIAAVVTAVGGVIEAVFNGMAAVITAVGGVFESIGTAIKFVLEGIGAVVESVGSAIESAFRGWSEVVESTGAAVKDILTGLGEAFESFGTGAKTALEGVEGVITALGDSASGVLDSLAGVIESVGSSAEKAGNGFKMVGEGVSEILQYNLMELSTNLGAVIGHIINLSNNHANISAAGTALSSLSNGFTSLSTTIPTVDSALSSLNSTIPGLNTSIDGASQSVTGFGTNIQNGITNAVPYAQLGLSTLGMAIQASGIGIQNEGTNIGTGFGTSLSGGLSTGIPGAQANASAIGNAAVSGASTSMNSGIGNGIGNQFGLGIQGGVSGTIGSNNATSSSLAQGSVGAVRGGFAPANSLGNQFGSGIRGGIAGTIGSNNSTSSSLAQGSVSAVRGGFAPANSLGNQFGSGIASGVRSTSGAVSSAGSSVASAGRSGAQSVSWVSSGTSLAQGLANGISSMAGHVMSVAASLASRAAAAVKNALNINSPSRVTREYGKSFSEGFIVGIQMLFGQAERTSVGLVDRTVDAISDAGEAIQSAIDYDLDLSPQITPVVDMTNLDKLSGLQYGNIGIGANVTGNFDGSIHRNGGQGVSNNVVNNNEYSYDVSVNVSGKAASNPREIAMAVQEEIKRMNDRVMLGRGEQPVW